MADIKQILGDLSQAVITLAKGTFSNFRKEAEADSIEFLNTSKVDLEKWTLQFANGDIDQDNITSLIKGQKDLLLMNALTEKGIALSTLDQFRNDVINLVLNTVISKLG
jgi:hypothetical protein